jgi:hypothetical protein
MPLLFPPKTRCAAWLVAALPLLAGCTGDPYDIVPVSGQVTLDGDPVAEATVSFEPVGEGNEPQLGPGSFGVTDAEGRYTLETVDRRRGAVVGEHRVTISTFRAAPDRSKMEVVREEEIPARYSGESELTFVVPPEGSEGADFELVSE